MLERATSIAVDRFTVPELPAADDTRFAAFVDQWGAHFLRWTAAQGPDAFRDRVQAAKARRRAA